MRIDREDTIAAQMGDGSPSALIRQMGPASWGSEYIRKVIAALVGVARYGETREGRAEARKELREIGKAVAHWGAKRPGPEITFLDVQNACKGAAEYLNLEPPPGGRKDRKRRDEVATKYLVSGSLLDETITHGLAIQKTRELERTIQPITEGDILRSAMDLNLFNAMRNIPPLSVTPDGQPVPNQPAAAIRSEILSRGRSSHLTTIIESERRTKSRKKK
jgi:hypothetical protein